MNIKICLNTKNHISHCAAVEQDLLVKLLLSLSLSLSLSFSLSLSLSLSVCLSLSLSHVCSKFNFIARESKYIKNPIICYC